MKLSQDSNDTIVGLQREDISAKFAKTYHTSPTVISQAPGRAEIIGNHTDYNNGYALGAAITKHTLVAVSRRSDEKISLFSEAFDTKPFVFLLSEIEKKEDAHWSNYIKGVVLELSKKQPFSKGFNMFISSNVPSSGGVSSSAALELSVGLALIELFTIKLSTMDLALLCKAAENGELVDSPCGFLDQATSAFSKKGNLLFLDFLPKDSFPISKKEYIPVDLKKYDASFLIIVDKHVKRSLGQSGYPARRAMCEQSLPILSNLLKRPIESLREVGIEEFELHRQKLEEENPVMRMRVEHIIYENKRVLQAVAALKENNIPLFGRLLTDSGKSALELYELDEKTPELTFLVEKIRSMDGVLGVRNMGGGFSANVLTLVKNNKIDSFKEILVNQYQRTYHSHLDFTMFQPTDGAKICYSE